MGDSHGLSYVDPRDGQGLEAPPRTSTSHLATDPGSRPSAAQPRTELSVATRPRSTTMEAACAWERLRSSPGLASDDDDDEHSATSLSCNLT